MKVLLFLLVCFYSYSALAQADTVTKSKKVRIVLMHAQEYIGYVQQENAKEILLELMNGRLVYIPTFKIIECKEVFDEDFSKNGYFVGRETYYTSYFLSCAAWNLKKGDHYSNWNALGPLFHFSVSDKMGIGLFSSWAAVPIGTNIKYTLLKKQKFALGVGSMLATGSWGAREYAMAVPYTIATFGDLKRNYSFGIGYGLFNINNDREDHPLLTFGFLSKKTPNISLVLDAIFFLPGKDSWQYVTTYVYDPNLGKDVTISTYQSIKNPAMWALIPGIRWNKAADKSFQFGFTGIYYKYNFIPLPVFQWMRKF